jgi:hypothetical protein
VDSYDYVDENNVLRYRVVRKEGWDDVIAQFTGSLVTVRGHAVDIRSVDSTVQRRFLQPADAQRLKDFIGKTIAFSIDQDGMLELHREKRFIQLRPYYGEGKEVRGEARQIVGWIYHLSRTCDTLKHPNCLCRDPGKPAARRAVRSLPYNYPDIIRARASGEAVFLVEGEKCVKALANLRLIATTASGGARALFADAWKRYLAGIRVLILIPDSDADGRDAARKRMEILRTSVRRIVYADLFPNRTDGYDLHDWIEDRRLAGCTEAEIVQSLRELVQDAAKRETGDVQPATSG